MKRQGHLFESISEFKNLYQAAHRALRGKKQQDYAARFFFYLEPELFQLEQELKQHSYQPRPYTSFEVKDPKPRQICAADFRDRVVHHGICHYLEPVLESCYIHDSYACRTGKGSHAAIRRAQAFSQPYEYVLKFDIKKYVASIDHGVLKKLLRNNLKDNRLLCLLELIIQHPFPDRRAEEKGLPIGNLTRQHFANLYLDQLDHFIKEHLQAKAYLRYMDDHLIFSHNKAQLWRWLKEIEAFLEQSLQLQLKPPATSISPVSQGFNYLGFRIYPQLIRLQQRTLKRFRRQLRTKEQAYLQGKISEDELSQQSQCLLAHVQQANVHQLNRQLMPRISMIH